MNSLLSVVVDLIDSVGPGGQYLSKQHTRDNLRKDHAIPSEVISRLSQDKWIQEGAKDSVSLALEQAEKILDAHKAEPLPEDRAAQLDSAFSSILQKHGISEAHFHKESEL